MNHCLPKKSVKKRNLGDKVPPSRGRNFWKTEKGVRSVPCSTTEGTRKEEKSLL